LFVGAAAGIWTAAAATLTVTNLNDSGVGSLRQALALASAGDTINFAVPANSTIVLTSELAIANGISIVGSSATALTISGNHTSRIFNITSLGSVTISGMTLRDGHPSGGATGGGAILINTGAGATPVNLTDVVVTGNDVSAAGNPLGGGIDNEGGTVTIIRSSIVNNVASFRGGGIQDQGFGSMTIVNSTIANNTAGNSGVGGGIRTLIPLSLTNCTIFGNSAQSGGNISVAGGAANVQDTIIAGGMVFGGSGPDVSGPLNSLDYNLIQDVTSGTITGATSHNITGVAPLLGPLTANGGLTLTMAPLAGSPVLDAGNAAPGVSTDQRGLPRPVDLATISNAAGGNGSDIGAVEAQSSPGSPTVPALSNVGLMLCAILMGLTGGLALKNRTA
jgi:hypothetical protein